MINIIIVILNFDSLGSIKSINHWMRVDFIFINIHVYFRYIMLLYLLLCVISFVIWLRFRWILHHRQQLLLLIIIIIITRDKRSHDRAIISGKQCSGLFTDRLTHLLVHLHSPNRDLLRKSTQCPACRSLIWQNREPLASGDTVCVADRMHRQAVGSSDDSRPMSLM